MDIVLDFDGTVVTHDFPKVGQDIGAEPVLKELVAAGHKLILFTMRSNIENPTSEDPTIIPQGGTYLTDAVKWFKERDIPLFGIQTNPTQKSWTTSPKAYGQLIIDDTALGVPLTMGGFDGMPAHHRPFVWWAMVREYLVDMNILESCKRL